MRILISNPDGIGDLVLRQPMFVALIEAGHELALLVRSEAAPIAKWLAPGARVLELRESPFRPQFDGSSPSTEHVLGEAKAFDPDALVIAPYQRTVFDELVAESLQGTRVFGFNGYLYRGDIGAGLDHKSRLQMTTTVPVPVEMHELQKSEHLCSALLERIVTLPAPHISLRPEDLEPAHARVAQLGLQPGRYWTACVGNSPYNAVRNWGLESWASLLSHFAGTLGHKVLLTGTQDEDGTTEEIRRKMGGVAGQTVNVCASGDTLETLVGLSALSGGYIGRDTGPMHIAAALSKPVLAVFGAGNWPRFTPVAQRGAVVTVKLDCAGCNYLCHLSESYCIKRVPVNQVIDALDDLEQGMVNNVRILALEPDRELTAHIVQEASLLASEKDRRAAADRQELAALRSRDDQQQMVIDHLTEGVQQERQKWMIAAAAHDLARSEAVHLRSALQTLETAQDCERREFQDRMAEAHRERQALIKGRDQLSDSLRLSANWLRLARIDVETVRANEGRQREQLLTMLSAGGREIHALMAERGQPSSQAEPVARRSDEVPPAEVSLLEAVRISIRRISQAKGQRWREALVLAAAARARVRRQLRSLRNPRHQ